MEAKWNPACCPFQHTAETELTDEVAFIKGIIDIRKGEDIEYRADHM